MKATLVHYFFAYDLPFRGYLGCWAILGGAIAVAVCEPSRAMFGDWMYCGLFVVSVLLGALMFMFMSLPIGFIFLGPAYQIGDRLAGAPFQVGDRVRILIGRHRDRVVEIYEVWDTRRQIRVRLDAKAEREIRDVFSYTQVLRM